MNAIQQKLEQFRAEIDNHLNSIESDDLCAQQQALGIVVTALSAIECISHDERVRCEECHDRIDDEDDSNDGLCVSCRRDNYSMLSARENAYQARN